MRSRRLGGEGLEVSGIDLYHQHREGNAAADGVAARERCPDMSSIDR